MSLQQVPAHKFLCVGFRISELFQVGMLNPATFTVYEYHAPGTCSSSSHPCLPFSSVFLPKNYIFPSWTDFLLHFIRSSGEFWLTKFQCWCLGIWFPACICFLDLLDKRCTILYNPYGNEKLVRLCEGDECKCMEGELYFKMFFHFTWWENAV